MATRPDSPVTHMILYSPINKDYHVDEKIKEKLTEEVFYDKCFVHPHFMPDEHDDVEGIDYADEADDKYTYISDYKTIEIKKTAENNKLSYDALIGWINDSGDGVYCIKGDAGTGKSTFLHYMKNKNKMGIWSIVDLQNAVDEIDIYSQRIKVKEFYRLDNKVISAILVNIKALYFPTTRKINEAVENMESLYCTYLSREDKPILQSEPVRWFFEDAELFKLGIEEINDDSFRKHVVTLCKQIQDLINQEDKQTVISYLLDIYLTLLRLKNPTQKHIIAFDNIERFIGNDEIFNDQIGMFVSELRRIQATFIQDDPDYLSKCQYIVLMRNTTSRMITHIHSASFGGHDLDLTGWFPADDVIKAKLDWYEENNFKVDYSDLIYPIIGINSFDGQGVRSVQEKLGRLLNRDKRMIVNVLDSAFRDTTESNPDIIKFYKKLLEDQSLPQKWVRLAARSIIIRLALDVLKADSFFNSIKTMEEGEQDGDDPNKKVNNDKDKHEDQKGDEDEQKVRDRWGYARKILTILYDYSLQHKAHYMPFDDIMKKMDIDHHDKGNAALMSMLSSILFSMNYYNRRSEDLFRLIDIQYNLEEGSQSINTYEDLLQILTGHSERVGIRIVEAGKGYLEYIVQSFEYFSCRYVKKYLPPLFCLIPSLEDLKNKDVKQMKCYEVITKVKEEAKYCINYMKENSPNSFPFRCDLRDKYGISHVDRIVYAHQGYIGNFLGFLRDSYNYDSFDPVQKAKFDALNKAIRDIHIEYDSLHYEENRR